MFAWRVVVVVFTPLALLELYGGPLGIEAFNSPVFRSVFLSASSKSVACVAAEHVTVEMLVDEPSRLWVL
jgi:hypothetical protein